MSRVGKKPIIIPSGVELTLEGNTVTVKGPKGTLTRTIHPLIQMSLIDGEAGKEVTMTVGNETEKNERAQWGTARSLIANMVQGVSQGYEKRLEIIGVGYKAQAQGKMLTLNLGFSHPINFPVPEGIEVAQEEQNKNILVVRGIDKQLVGQTAANIRSYRPPEPYKGKGIRYSDEHVLRKPGKTAAKSSS